MLIVLNRETITGPSFNCFDNVFRRYLVDKYNLFFILKIYNMKKYYLLEYNLIIVTILIIIINFIVFVRVTK